MAEVLFDPEGEEFNLYLDGGKIKSGYQSIKYEDVKWHENQLAFFKELKAIKQNIWIQIYGVYLNAEQQVTSIEFRITPEASFYHEYPSIQFDENGKVKNDIEDDLESYRDDSPEAFKLVKKFLQVAKNFKK